MDKLNTNYDDESEIEEIWIICTIAICIALRKTGPSSPGPVRYITGPADIIQKYGTGPVDSVQIDLN